MCDASKRVSSVTLLDLFADDATIEDPVGTDLREVRHRGLHCRLRGVAKASLSGNPRLAGNELPFPLTSQRVHRVKKSLSTSLMFFASIAKAR